MRSELKPADLVTLCPELVLDLLWFVCYFLVYYFVLVVDEDVVHRWLFVWLFSSALCL